MRTLILLAATTAALLAADGDYKSSIRLGLTSMPDESDLEFTARNTVTDVEVSDSTSGSWEDGNSRLSISAFHNTGGPVAFNIGVGVALTGYRDEDQDAEATMSQIGVLIEPGVSFNISPRFAVEIGMPIGVGSARLEFDDGTDAMEWDDGSYIEIGGVIRPVLKLNRFVGFLELGWITNHAVFDYAEVESLPNVEMDAELTTSGTFISLGGGIAF